MFLTCLENNVFDLALSFLILEALPDTALLLPPSLGLGLAIRNAPAVCITDSWGTTLDFPRTLGQEEVETKPSTL